MNSHPPSSILNPHRIVVRGVNWLGDAVMTTPALLRLRERFPNAHIALLTPENLCDLWLHHPAINEIITFPEGKSAFSISRNLRKLKFDLALILPNSPRSAMEAWLAGIPERMGYARPWRNWFLTTSLPPRADAVKMRKRSKSEIRKLISEKSGVRSQESEYSKSLHQIFEYLHLTAALGANPAPLPPQINVTDEEVSAATNHFGITNLNITRRLVFGLNAGAQYGPAKCWPMDRFIAVAKEIQQQTNCVWLIFGGKADMLVARHIESAIRSPHKKGRHYDPGTNDEFPVCNFAGKTSLRELCALLKSCNALLTNDSGPMHVAAALGMPVVVPFGSTSPELTGPFSPDNARHQILKSNAPCSPCFRRRCPIDFRCMKGITVERAVEAMMEVAESF